MDRRADNPDLGGETSSPPRTQATLWIVLGAFALTILLYWPTSLEIADLWNDRQQRGGYAHGWLVLAAALWLIWHDSRALLALAPKPPIGGSLVIAFVSVIWLIGFFSGVQAVTTLAMPILVLTFIWAAAGLDVSRRVALPVLLLYFALPVWGLVNPILQSLTAIVNLWLARLIGIPVVMTEHVIHIPAGSFEIADGCSGLHFFLVAMCIATIQGQLERYDIHSRIKLLVLAGSLAIAMNWLRAFVVIVAGHMTNMQHFLVRVDHYYFGWVLFACAIAVYLWLSKRLTLHSRENAEVLSSAEPDLGIPKVAAIVLAGIALTLGPAWSVVRSQVQPSTKGAPIAPLLSGWRGPEPYSGWWRPIFVGADTELTVRYSDGAGVEVAMYSATYNSQREGKELINAANSVVGSSQQAKPIVSGMAHPYLRSSALEQVVAVRSNGANYLIWSTYTINGQPRTMGRKGRLEYGIRSLFGYPTAGVVALMTECRPDCDSAMQALSAIVGSLHPRPRTNGQPDTRDEPG